MGDAAGDGTERFLGLLRSQHEFPGSYTFKIIYRNEPALGDAIVEAVCSSTGLTRPSRPPDLLASSTARFVAMDLELHMQDATEVLAVYRVLSTLRSIISYF